MIRIRTATLDDAQQMLDIYSPYVLETSVSFELEAPALSLFQQRVSEKLGQFPWLVCEMNDQIVGYAYAGEFRTRPAYAWTVESSVYVRSGFLHQGIGKELYKNLLQILKDQGVVNVIGGITLPNEASVKLHEQFGFTNVAQIKNAGFKMGQWWDVGYWQLQIQKPQFPRALQKPTIVDVKR